MLSDPRQSWILDSTLWALDFPDSLFVEVMDWAEFRVPKHRIPDSTIIKFPDSGIHKQKFSSSVIRIVWNVSGLLPITRWKETTDISDDNPNFLTGGERKDNFSSYLYWLRNTGVWEATTSLTNPAAWSVNESHGCRRTLNSGYL